MITPAYGLTATERVLPRLALDWTTGLAQTGVDVTRAGVATFVGSNGLIQSATADTQRIDYSTGTAGLLVEESRQNLCRQSEDLSVSPWNLGAGGAITTNAWVAPDGQTTGDIFTMGTDASVPSQFITISSSTTYVFSFYINKPLTTVAFLRLRFSNATSSVSVYLNMSTLTFGSYGSGVSNGVVTQVSSDVYRVSVQVTYGATDGGNRLVGFSGTTTSGGLTGDAGKDIAAWGMQFEQGAFPTSYIPTEATAVTRNADVATMTGTNFSDWFNASEGTFAATGVLGGNSINRDLIVASDGTTSNTISIRWASGSQAQYSVFDTGALQANIAPGGYSTLNTSYKRVCGYKTNNFAQGINGTLVGTDTLGTVPVVDRLNIGASGSAVANLNGWVSSIYYWPQKLTNAEIAAFSKQE
jgi:hypothetical protein